MSVAAAQLGLLDWQPPPTAPHVAGSTTSREAARAIRPAIGALHQALLEVLERFPGGLTDEQMQAAAAMQPSTQRPRRVELVARGLVVDSGETRPTRSGRRAVVWRASK